MKRVSKDRLRLQTLKSGGRGIAGVGTAHKKNRIGINPQVIKTALEGTTHDSIWQ